MQQEILNKLHTALYPLSPLASDRERIIETMGETIWLESLDKTLDALTEEERTQAVALLNDGELDKAIDVVTASSVDLNAIIREVSESVLNEVLSKVKA